jgi:ABC-type polysaccharide/polyol phosphate export permease
MKFSNATIDVLEGFLNLKKILYFANQEVKLRYRRSVLGPVWNVLTTAVLIGAMGPLYSILLNQPLSDYFLYFSSGFIIWNFLSSTINDFSNVYVSSEPYMKQVKLPYTFYLLKSLFRNLILFSYNFIIILFVLYFIKGNFKFNLIEFLLGFIFIVLNLIWIGGLISLLCTRFRDFSQIISNILQVLFFITPIIWQPNMLQKNHSVVDFNYFYYLILILRDPIIGISTPNNVYALLFFITFIGLIVYFLVFKKYYNKIILWV